MWVRHSAETIASVARFAAEGMSGSQIAAQLGITRNAAIGLAARNNIRFAGAPSGGKPKVEKPPKTVKPQMIKTPTYMQCEAVSESFPDDLSGLITFEQLDDTSCRYPVGDSNFLFCGNTKFEDLPYCPEHCRICFQPPRGKSNVI